MEENEENKDIIEEEPTEVGDEGMKVYELGFLIVPSVAEEKLSEAISAIKSVMEKEGSVFLSDQYPRLQNLAYTIFRSIEHKNQAYNQAYFGWIKFELDSSKIGALKSNLEKNLDLLRFIIIKTVKENTLYTHKLAPKRDKIVKKSSPDKLDEKISVEEIDKSIEDLVATSE